MKQKVIIFMVGLLVGAIISTGAIFFYTLAEGNSQTNVPQMDAGQMGPNGQTGGQMNGGGTPPEKPTSNNQVNS